VRTATAVVNERIREWVLNYFSERRPPPVTVHDSLKDLKFDDNSIMAFRRACINDLGVRVSPVQMKAEFNVENETLLGLITFLSEQMPAAVHV